MSDRYIPGVPCWVNLLAPDPEEAAVFYRGLFGWQLEDVAPADAPGSYFIARLPGGDVGAIGSQPEGDSRPPSWNTYVWVADVDETAARVRDAGGTVLMEPVDIGDSGRTAICADPGGAAFNVWQAAQHRGATVVNEPGSVNFNDLYTTDLEGAKAFYRAVFGWDLLAFGDDGGMWTLPAYGDFLEQRSPGLRASMREMGAPDHFEEVVASARVATDGEPSHWGVTFAVEDADATAARAAELGGQVVVPPTDAPWVRSTVIADPQGATFTANKFVPENRA
jgi:predicted enzyme related to lactoylglutathione lyase